MRVAALPTPVEIDLATVDVGQSRELARHHDRVRPPTLPGDGVAAPASHTAPRATTLADSARLSGLDAARLLATFGIVWTHVAEAQGLPLAAGTLGRFGTSFYIVAAALFLVRGAQKPQQRGFWNDTYRRAVRILVPFFVWSLLYGVYYGQQGLRAGHSLKAITFWWGPAAGTAIHLWFLPFIFFWGAIGSWIAPRLLRWPVKWLLATTLVAGTAVYYVAYDYVFFAVNRYWLWDYSLHRLDRWIVEVPLFLTALLAMVTYFRLPERVRAWTMRNAAPLTLAGAGIFFVAQYLYGTHVDFIRETTHTEGRFMANVGGLGLLAVALCAPNWSPRVRAFFAHMAPLGRFTYLAFLCHMFVLEFLRTPLSWLPGYGSISTAILSCFIVFGGSLLFSSWIARTPRLRFLQP